MSEYKVMHQVKQPEHAADGVTVLYGPGELHEPGTLPPGVGYRVVVADETDIETAPAWAQPDGPPKPALPETAPSKTPVESAAPAGSAGTSGASRK